MVSLNIRVGGAVVPITKEVAHVVGGWDNGRSS
jgi:hypothetical protein